MRLRNTSFTLRSALLLVVLAAGVPAASGQESQPQDDHSFLTYVNKPWAGDLGGMRQRRMIRALVVYSRTNFFLDNGEKRGLAYDSLMAFEKDLNRRLKTNRSNYIDVVFVPVRHDDLLPALVDGRGDIAAANLTITPGRRELVGFSDPFVTGVSEQVITAPGVTGIATVDDLAGRQVFVRPSSSYYEHLTRLNSDFEKRGLAPIQIIATPPQLETEDLMEMVNAGLLPITVADSHLVAFWSQFFDNMTVHPEVTINTGGAIAWAMRRDSVQLKAMADDFLKRSMPGNLTGNDIFRTYLRNTRWVKDATADQDIIRFRQTVNLFKKYGDQYSFDYLLLAAQGYQESGLDQNMVSPVGAIGIMQVMPDTGRDMAVGDIRLIDPNIHAGTKYMRKLMDDYFGDAHFDDLNRNLFAFAAYNAGPNRVARLRRIAGTKGYDPNVWFDNVERMVAEQVGQEPVRYVSNIFKYYVAYKLAEDQRAERRLVKATVKEELRGNGAEKDPEGFFKKVFKKIF